MNLSNTLTSTTSPVTPSAKGVVTIYTCGPTVYDHAHIGNLRTFILDDILRRAVDASDNELQAVMNITDIDDKTIARSQQEHRDLGPMEALIESTRHYEELFIEDLEAVGIDTSLVTLVRATDSMPEIQVMILAIWDKGYAYESEGSIYFDLAKYRASGHDYGRLTNVDYSPRARIDNDEYDKNEARDFVLWKAAKDGEPFWDFQLHELDLPGRPGWHIECSAMATANLGQPITIHTGGIDLKFPHHENEIAQTTGATDNDLTQIFVHYNHLYVDGRKMSKSLGNFYTLADITEKAYDPLVFRILTLQASYASELNFTWESLDAARHSLLNLYAWADLTHQLDPTLDTEALAKVTEDINNDLDTPAALTRIFGYSEEVPSYELLLGLDKLLGLEFSTRADITDAERTLINHRQTARLNKDFDTSDKLRLELVALGLEIDDTPIGPRWRRTII
jgi:cysteinyl-tRNA synthetase